MAELTLTSIFGDSATQDGTVLTITKADLPLTASAANTGESLFVGTFLKASESLNPSAQAANPDIQITIDKDSSVPFSRNSRSYIRHTYLVTLDMPDVTELVDANSF